MVGLRVMLSVSNGNSFFFFSNIPFSKALWTKYLNKYFNVFFIHTHASFSCGKRDSDINRNYVY